MEHLSFEGRATCRKDIERQFFYKLLAKLTMEAINSRFSVGKIMFVTRYISLTSVKAELIELKVYVIGKVL